MEKFKKHLSDILEDQRGSVNPEIVRHISHLGYFFIGAGVLLALAKMFRKKPGKAGEV